MNTRKILIIASMAIAITACKKDDEAPAPTPSTPSPGTVDMAFNLYVGNNVLDLSTLYQDGAGHVIRFSKAKFYVSNVHLTDHDDNVLHNAPHTVGEMTADTWSHKYGREKAAFPLPYLRHGFKFWATVGRIDQAYGDRNLVCTCPPVEEYAAV